MTTIGCVDFCRALGDETRQELLKLLQEKGELCVTDLVREFGLSQPTISHHLILLKAAGLVTSRKAGKQVFYSVNQDNVTECCGLLMAQFTPESLRPVRLPLAEIGGNKR